MNTLIESLSSNPELLIPILAIIFGCSIPIVAVIAGSISKTKQSREYESTRRELAAYVAEGSMTPDDAERLLKAEPRSYRKRMSC